MLTKSPRKPARWGEQGALSAHVEMNCIKATGPPICYRNHHLHQQEINAIDMVNIRKSLSKLKKAFKHRLRGIKRGPDRAGASPVGERASPSTPFPRQDSRATVSGGDGGGGIISTEASQARPRDRFPQLKQADEGSDDPQGGSVGVDEEEVSRSRSRLDPEVGSAEGSGPSREIKQTSSLPSITPIVLNQEPDGTWTLSPQQLYLIVLLENADTPTVPDRVQQDLRSDENVEPSAAANKKGSDLKSTAIATAKLLLRGVRESADAFPPLKSVAGGLCYILDNYEVQSTPCTLPQL